MATRNTRLTTPARTRVTPRRMTGKEFPTHMRPLVVKGRFLPDVIKADFNRRSVYEWVPTDEIYVDPIYQRDLNKSKVSKFAHNWDNDLVGTFVVNKRDDGHYFVVDGQHRHAAIQRIENYPSHIYCEVFTNLSPQEEADLFYKLDTQRDNLTPAARFKALLAAGNVAALEIKAAAEETGFSADPEKIHTHGVHNLRAFNTLLDIYHRVGRAGIHRILKVCHDSWPDRKDAGAEAILRGLELFFARYPETDDKRLINILSITSPIVVISTARRIQEDLSSVIYSAVAQTIRGLYNKRLIHKLPNW